MARNSFHWDFFPWPSQGLRWSWLACSSPNSPSFSSGRWVRHLWFFFPGIRNLLLHHDLGGMIENSLAIISASSLCALGCIPSHPMALCVSNRQKRSLTLSFSAVGNAVLPQILPGVFTDFSGENWGRHENIEYLSLFHVLWHYEIKRFHTQAYFFFRSQWMMNHNDFLPRGRCQWSLNLLRPEYKGAQVQIWYVSRNFTFQLLYLCHSSASPSQESDLFTRAGRVKGVNNPFVPQRFNKWKFLASVTVNAARYSPLPASKFGNKIENYSVYIKPETTKKGKIHIWDILEQQSYQF